MNDGRIEQVGEPTDLYNEPATKFVAGFIGSPAMNLIPCTLQAAGDALTVRLTDSISFPVPEERAERYRTFVGHGKLILGIRPEHIFEHRAGVEAGQQSFETPIDVTEQMGMDTLVYFEVNGVQVCGRVSPKAGAQAGANMQHT